MIQVKKNDSLSVVIRKISLVPSKEVFLRFPIGHAILKDYSGLRILKRSFENKKLIFISKDISAKKLLKKVGITYTIIKDEEYLKRKLKEKPDILKHNTNFFEYMGFEMKKSSSKIYNKIRKHSSRKEKTQNISFSFIIILLTLTFSSILLLFVFYFAVHTTTVYMNPNTEIKKIERNFIFNTSHELSLDDRNIQLQKVEETIILEEDFSATSIEYETSKQATGKITIYNELTTKQTLIQGTRFLSDTGIIYRIKEKVHIPAASLDGSKNIILGEAQMDAEADPFDIDGNFVGTRGNVKNTILSIPGLGGEYTNRLYGKADSFIGGIDQYNVIVGEDDVENAGKLLETKLQNKALEKLQKSINTSNIESSEDIEILMTDGSIFYSDFSFTNKDGVTAGAKQKSFTLSGSIHITAYTYNKDFILTKLKNIASKRIVSDKQKIVFVDSNSLQIIHLIYNNKTPDGGIKIKATTELEVLISHNFDNSSFYTEILKNKIVGLTNTEAYDILFNTPNINNVEISNSPFFMKHVSSKVDNIFFKIKD